MKSKFNRSALSFLLLCVVSVMLIPFISSCGKQATASPQGLNVQYEILNLSPDLFPVDLFIDFKRVNTTPISFPFNNGYFYVPSIDTPYQIRSDLIAGTTFFSRDDILKTGLKYSLFITGTYGDRSIKQIFTVDTASLPATGRGKIRFVNACPSVTTGLDVYANGTQAFSKVLYTQYSKYIELPIGNYDFQINVTGSTTVQKDVPAITIEDGRLYTLYAYGYTTRSDSAAFNAGVITNK
jgi:hypothetical protein